tara:strand:+ start:301 stop:516 length:216 start_codon:yes stop_codon:yes gene_type:complete
MFDVNKQQHDAYCVGDLVEIDSDYTGNYLGVIRHIKKCSFSDSILYQIHLCEEDETDERWLYMRDIKRKVG